MLQVEYRVVVANGGFQQSFGVIGGRWHDNLDAGNVEEPRFRAEGMERAAAHSTAGWPANDHRHRYAAAPVKLAHHIDDLVEAAGDEVDKLHFGDGAHPHDGRAHG